MKYLFLLFLLCVSFFDLSAAVEGDANNASTSEKRKIDEPKGQKMEIESMLWIGGWGLCIKHYNETEQKIPIDFDRILLTAKNADFSGTYEIPFSFKGIISPQKINAYIVPLNDLDLPTGRYSLSLVFEKNKETEKDFDKKIKSEPVLQSDISEFFAPPDHYKTVSQINASDFFSDYRKDIFIPENVTLNGYYHCTSQNGDLYIRIRTEVAHEDKPYAGSIIRPEKDPQSALDGGKRKHTALSRLKIKITTGKKSKTVYYPLPVCFALRSGEKFEFSFCLKETEWDDKSAHLEIEHLNEPEGTFSSCFPSPISHIIFHKDKEK